MPLRRNKIIFIMTKIAEALLEEFKKAKENKEPYLGTKDAAFILDAVDEAGLQLAAHQNGIQGTYMTIKEK